MNGPAGEETLAGGPPSREPKRSTGRYTIDDLAALTSVPSRTIRFYQAKGALGPPVRRGRVAYYDDSHVQRLELVAHLQDRGLSLRIIRDLLERGDRGEVSVADWLGVGERLQTRGSDDRPRLRNDEEITIANEILRRQLARAADELVVHFVERREKTSGPDETARSIVALRSLGVDVVRLLFAEEFERALGETVAGGRPTPPARKKRR